jgi:phosphoribosylanthranilate isomerase
MTAMTAVKICGVTRVEDARAAALAGADFVGINFWPSSKRFVHVDAAAALARAGRVRGAMIVGIFVDASIATIAEAAGTARLDVIQLHGDESPATCAEVRSVTGLRVWKALPVASAADIDGLERWPVHAILLDAATPGRGGSGRTIDWGIAARATESVRPIVLAGGLDPGNVAAAVTAVKPWAVDVASGVESAPGIKDPAKIAAFIRAVREVV